MVSTIRSKVLLSIAILRELNNKVNYYKSVVNKNIDQYNEYIAKTSKIFPEKIRNVEKEVGSLKILHKHLDSISIFLEGIILRLETLTISGNAVAAAVALKDVVKILKKNMKYGPPILSVLVDRLNDVSKSLVLEIENSVEMKGVAIKASSEALKIIEEAKKVSGIE
ncbi:MAG: hypothetical protein QW101_00790 [Ignisphaera sp.]|uniref:DUF47 family protein n=1 Tax=Ignisphaera aggregans TaxID=334771 RepID=A0A7J3MYA9_9CREN